MKVRYEKKEAVLARIKDSYWCAPSILRDVSPALKNDKEVVLAAVKLAVVKKAGSALMFAGEEIRNDQEVVLAAVEQHGWALQYASRELRNNRDFVMAAVRQNCSALLYANEDFRNDEEFVLAAVSQNGWALKYANEDLRGKQKIVFAAMKENLAAIIYKNLTTQDKKVLRDICIAIVLSIWLLPIEKEFLHAMYLFTLRNIMYVKVLATISMIFFGYKCQDDRVIKYTTKAEALAMVKLDGNQLRYVDEELKYHREVVLAAVSQNGLSAEYVPDYLIRYDKEIVLAAVAQNGQSLRYTDLGYDDKEIVLAAVKQDGFALRYAADFRSNKEVTLAAVNQNGKVLEILSTRTVNVPYSNFRPRHATFEKDSEVIAAAIRNDYRAIKYVSVPLDGYIIEALLSHPDWALQYASDDLKDDKDVVLAAVSKNGDALQYASERLKDDKEVVVAAITNNYKAYSYASENLKYQADIRKSLLSQNQASHTVADKEKYIYFIIEIIHGNPFSQKRRRFVLKDACERIKNNKAVVLAAVSKNGDALEYASDDLKDDKDVVLAAVKENGWALEYASERIKNNKAVVLAAVSKNGDALEYASERLKDDKNVVLAAVRQIVCALQYASERLKDDETIILAAGNLYYASERLKDDKNVVMPIIRRSPFEMTFVSKRLCSDLDLDLVHIALNQAIEAFHCLRISDQKQISWNRLLATQFYSKKGMLDNIKGIFQVKTKGKKILNNDCISHMISYLSVKDVSMMRQLSKQHSNLAKEVSKEANTILADIKTALKK